MDLWSMVSQCKLIDLSHEISYASLAYSKEETFSSQTIADIETHGYYVNNYQIPSQFGSHLDAPSHFFKQGRNLEGIDLEELILPLYVLHFEEEVAKDSDFLLEKSHILDYESAHGRIPEGCFVAFASNWSQRWNQQEAFDNLDTDGRPHRPGWSIEALKFLHEDRQVTAIGHETFDTDRAYDIWQTQTYPAQSYWLSLDKYQVELLTNLTLLPSRGALIIIAPLKIEGGPGSPVRAIAVVSI